MEILENLNELSNNIMNNLKNIQENFLETTIGKVANIAIDIGLKKVLPDFIEEEVIEVKDALITNGFQEGINTAINNAIDLGKSALGIFTGNFESIEQARDAIKEGGVIDGISESIDKVLKKLESSNIISDNISEIIKGGKNLILNLVEKNIKKEFENEIESVSNIKEHIKNWEINYENKDLEGLNLEYNKTVEEARKILPLKSIVEKLNQMENIEILANNNKDFDFSKEYLNLAQYV